MIGYTILSALFIIVLIIAAITVVTSQNWKPTVTSRPSSQLSSHENLTPLPIGGDYHHMFLDKDRIDGYHRHTTGSIYGPDSTIFSGHDSLMASVL